MAMVGIGVVSGDGGGEGEGGVTVRRPDKEC